MESGGSVGKLKRNEQPLFRGESAGFVNLPLFQHVAKLTGTSRSIPPEGQGYGCRFRFHGTILHGNNTPITTQEDDCNRDTPTMMGTRSPYGLILLRHMESEKTPGTFSYFLLFFVLAKKLSNGPFILIEVGTHVSDKRWPAILILRFSVFLQ